MPDVEEATRRVEIIAVQVKLRDFFLAAFSETRFFAVLDAFFSSPDPGGLFFGVLGLFLP